MSTLTELVKHYESLHDGDLKTVGLQPKMCPAGLWTEGYGRLVLDEKGNRLKGIENKAKAYKFSKIKTEAQAIVALEEDLRDYTLRVKSLNLFLSENQLAALVSFAYNIGFANLKTSTLLKKIQANSSASEITAQFLRWVYADKKTLPGLVARRKSEALLFTTGKLQFFN